MAMTLPQYIASRRELDGKSVRHVWAVLLQHGKVDESVTFDDVAAACSKARELVEVYLL